MNHYQCTAWYDSGQCFTFDVMAIDLEQATVLAFKEACRASSLTVEQL